MTTNAVRWDEYEPCPTCLRTWSCIRVRDTALSARGFVELKRPHPARRLKHVATEALPGV